MKHTEKDEKLISEADNIISDLVYDKVKLKKAYRYYHGKRDPEQFKHLEENYGIGNATSVEFVPLTRKHVDVLVGEFLTIPLQPNISCKDSETLSNIYEEKQNTINKKVNIKLKDQLIQTIKGGSTKSEEQLLREITELQEDLERNFVSSYEIAAQNIVDWLIQSRNIDFQNKRRMLLLELLITGTAYFKVLEKKDGLNIKVLSSLDTFLDRNYSSNYNKESLRGVSREYLTKHEILIEYGKYLSKDQVDSLDSYMDDTYQTYSRGHDFLPVYDDKSTGILGGYEVTPNSLNYDTRYFYNRFPVYDVEWIQSDKEDGEYIMNRYRVIKIGENIYIPLGKDKKVQRSVEDPTKCSLSINGMFFSDRNGEPISLMLETASLQDKYDVLSFYRDNLIANSGTKGDWVDIAFVPTAFGAELTERLLKFEAYKKQGKAYFDSSQEGRDMMNTHFGGFDNTIRYDAIQAIDLAMQRVEEACSTITGVFREKLGGIEERDAVSNVQVGIRQSTYITKQYFYTMDLITREMLLDSLNMAKIVYKKGLSGTLVLGDKLNKIFTALPEHYTMTDFDVHIQDTSKAIQDNEMIRQLGFEWSKSNTTDPEIVLEVITSTSLTKMKEEVLKSLRKKKEENNIIAQLTQQLEQAQAQLGELGTSNQSMQSNINKLTQENLQLAREKFAFEKELKWYEAREKASFNDRKIKVEEKKVEAEILQLYDNNPHNDEIKW